MAMKFPNGNQPIGPKGSISSRLGLAAMIVGAVAWPLAWLFPSQPPSPVDQAAQGYLLGAAEVIGFEILLGLVTLLVFRNWRATIFVLGVGLLTTILLLLA